MSFFLYHRRTRPTGRALREALEMPGGYGFSRYERGTSLIRWGNSQAPELDREAEVLNRAVAIDRARNKLRTFEMLGAMFTQTPDTTCDPEFVRNNLEDAIWFGRKATGFGGTDIQIIEAPGFFEEGFDFYSKYIPNEREFRIHVFKGEAIRVQKKCLVEGNEPSLVKNHANGYIYQSPARQPHSERIETAIRAVNLLELDFGAVDLIVPTEAPEKSVVLEVNTAPACSPLTLSKYVEAFRGAS